ncbi:MAG: 4Fe-4S dicluster domain-containing protein [Archangiaceae bacterium]|nr:4Fe-4S dicluster domain-containing protein [Archangiaceae bacterium]
MRRRAVVLGLGATAATGLLARRAEARARIRPPGALPAGAFEQTCIGCQRCAEVCPPKAIRFTASFAADGATPYLDTRDTACTLCMKCPQVCPTGALVPLAAEDVRMGEPVLDRSRCLPWNGSGNCRLCYYVCPYPDRAVELVGAHSGPLFHPEACVGCGLCEEACPDLATAIRIVPKGKPK